MGVEAEVAALTHQVDIVDRGHMTEDEATALTIRVATLLASLSFFSLFMYQSDLT